MTQRVVTAEEVAPQVKRMLRTLRPHELDEFEKSIESGRMIGRYWDRCYFGTQARACSFDPGQVFDRDRVFENVRNFTRGRFGITLKKDELNDVELFFHEVRGHQTPKGSPVLAHLAVLMSEVREELSQLDFATVSEAVTY